MQMKYKGKKEKHGQSSPSAESSCLECADCAEMTMSVRGIAGSSAPTMALTVILFLWIMAAAHPVVPLGLLNMQHLQKWFASLCLVVRKHKQHLVTVLPSVQGDVR